jgi:hypothetical protein
MNDRLQVLVDRVALRVRTALDLPSRAELMDLTQRLEELDRRIAALSLPETTEDKRAPKQRKKH